MACMHILSCEVSNLWLQSLHDSDTQNNYYASYGLGNRKRVKYKENKNANKDEKSSVSKAEGGRRSQQHVENDCDVKAQ